jgi:hypothetical protein
VIWNVRTRLGIRKLHPLDTLLQSLLLLTNLIQVVDKLGLVAGQVNVFGIQELERWFLDLQLLEFSREPCKVRLQCLGLVE